MVSLRIVTQIITNEPDTSRLSHYTHTIKQRTRQMRNNLKLYGMRKRGAEFNVKCPR